MENKRRIPEAISCRNGIIFISGITNKLVVKSYYDSDTNTIETLTRWYTDFRLRRKIYYDLKEPEIWKKKLHRKAVWCINLALIVYSALIARNINYTLAALCYSFTVSKDLYLFIQKSFKMKILNGQEKEMARYHSAEHMVLNAYQKLGKVPSLEEIKTFSRFNEYCGTRIIASRIIEFLPISLAIAFSDKINIIVYVLIFIISWILGKEMLKKDFIKVEQILFTEPPTDLQLKVAIKGLETLLNEEKEIKIMLFEY